MYETDHSIAEPPQGPRKAWFRAVRETCGITPAGLAKAVDVSLGEVLAWESPAGPEPAHDACQWLAGALADHWEQVDGIVDDAVEKLKPGEPAVLEYVCTQAQFERLYPHLKASGIPCGYHTATLRAAFERLRYLGIPVVWRYPEG